jgi:hypothetical protein
VPFRFYDATSGKIIFGDSDITEIDPKSYRKKLSLVAQESTLYEGTIRENVSLSVEESEATDEAIQEACSDSQIHEFITSLPEGLFHSQNHLPNTDLNRILYPYRPQRCRFKWWSKTTISTRSRPSTPAAAPST